MSPYRQDTTGFGVPPHTQFDNRFAVPPDHFGAHKISPHQQSFVDPDTGHIHHFAHPPPPPSNGFAGGLLDDITSAFFGSNRRLGLSSSGTIVGGMRETLRDFLYGTKVTSSRRRFRRQTSSIQGNIIRLLKVNNQAFPPFPQRATLFSHSQATDMDTSNMFPYVRAALIGHGSRNSNTRNSGRRGSCAQLYRECPAHPEDIVDYLNNHKGGLVNQERTSYVLTEEE